MSALSSLRLETGAEILKALRAPEYMIPTMIFPVGFYLLFGVVLSMGSSSASYLLATYGIFAVMGPSIFGFGIAVANERDKGWLSLKRAAPAPGINYILAKIIATLIFASIAVALIHLVAGFLGDVALPKRVWTALLLVHIASTLPFILIGLTIGFLLKTNAAMAIANLVFMGLAVLGGLWIPIMVFPSIMQKFAQFLPTYHLGEIALYVGGAKDGRDIGTHVTIIAIMTIMLMIITIISWSRQRE